MKKGIILLLVSTVLLAACHKSSFDPSNPTQPSLIGTWNVDTLTTYFYDSTGLREKGVHVYPAGALDYPYRFRFNEDYTWVESSHFTGDSDYVAANGTYTLTSDSSFTLVYNTAVLSREAELCKILSLDAKSLVFSKQLTTVFNGTIPGYIKYVFQLSRL